MTIYEISYKFFCKNWATRYNSFDKISEFITELTPSETINDQIIESLISTHIQHLNDSHIKVVGACMNSLTRLITLFPNELFNDIDHILPQVLLFK